MPWKELDLPSDAEQRRLDREYQGKARFLVDESIGVEVANVLRERGYNTKYVGDIGFLGRSDEDVFAAAWKDKRIIVTHDPDFLDDRRFPPHRNPGIVLVRPGSSGRDSHGLLVCLMKTVSIAGKNAKWFRKKKLDFSSEESLTITSPGMRVQYLWRGDGSPLIWENS